MLFFSYLPIVLCLGLALEIVHVTLASGISLEDQRRASVFPRNADAAPLITRATLQDVDNARKIVKEAIEKSSKLNKLRLQNPGRNTYRKIPVTRERGPGTVRRSVDAFSSGPAPPLLNITVEVAAAAALVAEAEAIASLGDGHPPGIQEHSSFWMETIARRGTSPWGDDPTYKVFRNVRDYGAKGDGVTDDTAAINKAMSDGKRCGQACNGSTTKNAIIYFPPGTYLVSSPIVVYFGTQLIGDAKSRPTIKAAASFVGLGVVSTDVYVGDGTGADGKDNEWYVNTANFYRQIRNFKIDITATHPDAYVCALHYQVAQATSLQYVELVATTGTTQQGIFAENGSGGVIADVTFTGGNFGLYGGSQQFTAQRLTFNGCKTAVQIIWDWGWVWKSIIVNNAEVGFRLVNDDGTGNVGSAAFMDASFTNVKQAIVIAPPSSEPGTGTTGLVLDNVAFSGVGQGVADTAGNTLVSGSYYVSSWVLGPLYNSTTRTWSSGTGQRQYRDADLTTRDEVGLPEAPYFERAKPQYVDSPVSDFIHLKDFATGDGSTDDTAGVQKAFNSAGNKIIYADAGIYTLTNTVTIPAGTRIVGEAWAQFAATGPKFQDPGHPRVMLKVGEPGSVGLVEMQDLLFTTKGPTPGVILVQWNIQASSKGSAALWDCHARLGGATGTGLTPTECPAVRDGTVRDACKTAALVMHVTSGSSGYFDNMWLWTADHMIDDPDLVSTKNEMTMISVYTARGLLIESQEATWFYGTASEHAVFYQYNFHGAQNSFAGLLQTESPYYQPSPPAPSPFKSNIGVFASDPKYNCTDSEFDGCDSSWGLIIERCQDIYVSSAGIYSWFDDYTQDCINQHSCQKALVYISQNYRGVRLQQLVTIGAKYSVVADEKGVLAADNLAIKSHPSWSQISLFDTLSRGNASDEHRFRLPACADKTWDTLSDLYASIATFPKYCLGVYATSIMARQLDDALVNYTALDNGYDEKFDAYERYTKEMVPAQLRDFMETYEGPGNKYFDCTLDVGSGNSTSRPCPISRIELAPYDRYTLYYTLRDPEGFYGELDSKYGISPDWVKFGEQKTGTRCINRKNCDPTSETYEGVPLAADNITIYNPKDLISKALPGYSALATTILSVYTQMLLNTWSGADNEAIEVLNMPVSLAVQAVEGMKQVTIIGEEAQEEEKKQLILEILGIVFLIIPFAGEAVGAEASLLLRSLGRVISLIGATGNAGLTFYDIATDPLAAPMQILGLLLGAAGGFGRTTEDMTKMSKLRRSMDKAQLGKLGKIFKRNDDAVQKIAKSCSKRD